MTTSECIFHTFIETKLLIIQITLMSIIKIKNVEMRITRKLCIEILYNINIL